MFFLFCIFFLVSIIVIFRWSRFSPAGKIPTTNELPIIGDFIAVLRRWDDYLDWIVEQHKQIGSDIFTFWIPGQPRYVVINDPVDIKYFLKDNWENFEKGDEFHQRFHELLGDGIFNIDGDRWKLQRKTAAQLFKVKNFSTNMVGVFRKHALKLCKILDKIADTKETIDLQDLFFKVTLDSIGEIGFGVDINSLDHFSKFSAAFDFAQKAAQVRFFSPIWKLRKFFHPQEIQLRGKITELNQFAEKTVNDLNKQSIEDLEKRFDLLSIFQAKGKKDGLPFSDTYLRDLIMNFTIAGRDTTAQALSWQFYRLIVEDKKIENKLLNEIHENFPNTVGDNDDEIDVDKINFDSVRKLSYADAVFTETLRLHPSVPKDGKVVVKDCELPSGYKVKKGCWVVYVPYLMGRTEKLWENCESFQPERFHNKPKPSDFKFTAFQAGPRICLGKQMAYMEAKIVTSIVLSKFSFQIKENHKVTYQNNITLPMEGGLPVYVKRRK